MGGEDEEWRVVTSSSSSSSRASSSVQREEEQVVATYTKQQLKNQKRNARRRERKKDQEPRPPAPLSNVSLSDDEEGRGVVDADQDELDTLRELEKRFRKLSKSLKSIQLAEEKVSRLGLADPDIIAKTKRRDEVSRELEETRSLMVSVENAREERIRAEAKAARAKREELSQIFMSVRFDEKFACPICTEVVEAAVSVPCDHVFCRACLEDHVAKATNRSALCCPLCRADMCCEGKVSAKPAHSMRNKLKYANGKCHCGETLALNKLRDHLRQCGPKAHFFAPRRKFGHEFRQPEFLHNNK